MEQIIFHIDVNSAYLSWSAIKLLREGKNVDIRTIPAIIGGDKETRHGIVLAKSIAAKKFGIVTGEPVVDAYRKCPDLICVPPEHDYYHEQSRKFVQLLMGYTPDIEQVSVDECYMDFTGIRNKFESPMGAANIIKNRIRDELGFTVNIGISNRKVLAKMASDFEKPDKVHTLYDNEIKTKMWLLPVQELFMAGKSSVQVCHKLGIYTIGQLAETPPQILEMHLKSHGRLLWEYANGIDSQIVENEKEEAKGIGNSTTLSKDISNTEEVSKILLMLSEKVAGRIREAHQKAMVVCVEIKYADFTKVSRQMTVDVPVNTSSEIYRLACGLFHDAWSGKPVRLLGIRTTKLLDEDEPEQINLFDMLAESSDYIFQETKDSFKENEKRNKNNKNLRPSREKLRKLDEAIGTIRKKYGENAVSRASLLENTDTAHLCDKENLSD